MKIIQNGYFKNWCDLAPKVNGRIDWQALEDWYKDQAVIAYLLDAGTHTWVAERLQSATCPNWYKEGAYKNLEFILDDLIIKYNDTHAPLFVRDEETYDREPEYHHNQAMKEAGHDEGDF